MQCNNCWQELHYVGTISHEKKSETLVVYQCNNMECATGFVVINMREGV
jgi:hypothetical protein